MATLERRREDPTRTLLGLYALPAQAVGTADAEAQRTGERREGTVFAAKEFVDKARSAAVALAIGAMLQVAGFVPNVPQSETVQLAIRACLGLLPGAVLLVSAWLLRDLDLGDEPAEIAPRG